MHSRQKMTLEYIIKYLHISEISKYIFDVILYGSVARGEEHFGSDVDVLIVLRGDSVKANKIKENIRHVISDLADPWEIFSIVEEYYGNSQNDPRNIAETEARIITKQAYETANDTFYKTIKREGISIWTH